MHPDRDGERERRHQNGNGRVDLKTLVAIGALVLPGFAIGLIWWGKTEAKVDSANERITKLEGLNQPISDLKTAVAVLTEQISQLRLQMARDSTRRDERRDAP